MSNVRTVFLPFAAILLPAAALAGDGGSLAEITREDFYAAAYYHEALEHPAIKKITSDSKRLDAIAKDLKLRPATLQKAVQKVERLNGDPEEAIRSAILSGLETSRIKGRVLDVLINTSEPKHVVVYVRWQGTASRDAVKDASAIAHAVASEVPLVSTLSLAAIHPKAPKDSKDAVWSAKIGYEAMKTISPKRIDDYADRLYKRLFEGVEEKSF